MTKQVLILTMVAAALLTGVSACKEKKKSDDIIVAKYVPEQPKAPISMPTDKRKVDVNWLEKTYVVAVSRESDESLPMLTDETGQKYIDNRVSLSILRSDSSVFFKQSFTKESFASYIAGDLRQKGFLENIVFHGVEDQQLKFGVVVSRPGTDDEFVPLDLSIDRMGGMAITQGKLFDETPDSDNEP